MVIVIALNALDVVPFIRTLLSGPGATRTYFTSLLGKNAYTSNEEVGFLSVADEEGGVVFASATEHGESPGIPSANQDSGEKDGAVSSSNEDDPVTDMEQNASPLGPRGSPAAQSKIYKLGRRLVSFPHVLIVVLAYTQVLTGIIVYSGSCRASYLNG